MSLIIDGKYKIISRLGNGNFGMIFKGIHIITNEEIAVKIEKISHLSTLKNEAKIYNYLENISGMPKLRNFGVEGNYNYIVLDLLGESLETLKNNCGGTFSLNTISLLAIQMIRQIQQIHSKGIIHRDIKPQNILIHKNKLFFIDFGLATRFTNDLNQHIPQKKIKGFVGTLNYISINIHQHITPSRRDDLETIFYVLLYFLNGKLPWFDTTKHITDKNILFETIHREKLQILNNKSFFIPTQLVSFFNYCRNLKFQETPDYTYLIQLFFNVFKETNIHCDAIIYDWDVS